MLALCYQSLNPGGNFRVICRVFGNFVTICNSSGILVVLADRYIEDYSFFIVPNDEIWFDKTICCRNFRLHQDVPTCLFQVEIQLFHQMIMSFYSGSMSPRAHL